MKNLFCVKSEIGKLKTVLLHRPGIELENLTPKMLEKLLFDDIPWLDLAVQEHDYLANLFKSRGVEVLYLANMVAEALDSNSKVKQQFIKQFLFEANVHSETLTSIITDYLNSFASTKEMVEKTMAGIRKSELPNFVKRTLSDYIRDYPFVTDPMPNLYFTRDPFCVVGSGVMLNKMYTLTRMRETIYGEYIFKYHPVYGNPPGIYYFRDLPSTIEGGDVIVLSEKVIAVGVSERTHPQAIERLAKNLFYKYETSFEKVLAVDIPKIRAFMHLDTVFTQVDYNKFTTHSELQETMRVFELSRNPEIPGKLLINLIQKPLKDILEFYLEREIELIPCGGGDVISGSREQWSDGANTLAIAPGEVIVYQRNHITNELLVKNGIKIHTIPSSELSRGRGGPRCMTMPFYREDI
ncbi:MAG TPA: arginine deiminase [Acholeplasmataceae bacterium]|nr:arginine deiminase [Acholeplasmataceae bacterium]